MGLSKALKANINDAAINVNFSFDGTTTHGQLQAGETFSFENKSATKVYLPSLDVLLLQHLISIPLT